MIHIIIQPYHNINQLGCLVDKCKPFFTAASELYNNIQLKPIAYMQKLCNKIANPNNLLPTSQKNNILGY